MRKIKITADSSCDLLSLGTAELKTAPMKVGTGEREFVDNGNLDLADMLSSLGYNGGKISIGHCVNEAGAEALSSLILTAYPDADIEIHKLMGLCSFYAERGGILVGFEKA
jgi:fatty acid-binding protein DegV